MTWQFLTSLQPRAYIDDVEKTYQKEARDISMNIGSQRQVGSEESLNKCRTNRAARRIYP